MSNVDGIVFATQKNWRRINDDLSCLDGFAVITSRVSAGSVYFLLMDMSPLDWHSDRRPSYLLEKVTTNEETGKTDFFIIVLSRDESMLFESVPLEAWLE
jgi:hypothetical protein